MGRNVRANYFYRNTVNVIISQTQSPFLKKKKKKGSLFYLVGTGVYLVEPNFSCHWCKTNVITDSHTPLVLSGNWHFIDLPFHSNFKENVLVSQNGHWLTLHAQLYCYKSNETK